jgi:hypothetical protein
VYQSVRALGFEPVLYVYYKDVYGHPQGAMVDKLIEFSDDPYEESSVLDAVQEEGGIPVRQVGEKMPGPSYCDDRRREPVEWVTPLTTYNRQAGAFVAYGNEATLDWAYGDVCMIVRIGKTGDRMAFPTAAQAKSEYLGAYLQSRRECGYF